MQATYDVRRSSVQPLAITFAVAASLILGATGGFALKALTQAVIAAPAPVVTASLASHMAAPQAVQMTRLELQDQQSQSQSTAGQAISQGDATQGASRYGPR